jgi:hypothetical protein
MREVVRADLASERLKRNIQNALHTVITQHCFAFVHLNIITVNYYISIVMLKAGVDREWTSFP